MLISALLDRSVLPAETQVALQERAGGNPLFAESFVRMVTERGLLDGGSGLRLDPDDIPVPQTVQAIISARLDTLPAEHKALLQDASVLGKVFWSGALASMADLDEGTVEERLHEIARKELVRPVRASSVKGQFEYAFWHGLVRDVAYGQIPRAARGQRHRVAARWIELIAADRVADHAELLAHHYQEALGLVTGAGQEDPALERAAFRFTVMAGDRAKRLDVPRGSAYYRGALSLAPSELERAGVLVRLAETEQLEGRFPEAETTAREAADLYRAADDRVGLGAAMTQLARVLSKRGELVGAQPMLDEAVALLETRPPGPQLARAYSLAAGFHLISGRYAEALAWSQKALDLAESLAMEDVVVRALQNRGAAKSETGDPAWEADLREALRRGLELGLGEETAVAYGNLAYQVWLKKGPVAALELWDRAVEFAEGRGLATAAMMGRAGRLETLFDLGEWEQVLRVSDEMRAWEETHAASQIGVFAGLFRAWVLLRRGDPAAAAAVAEEILPQARRAGSAELLAPVLMIAAAARQARGDEEEAAALIEEYGGATEDQLDYRSLYLPLAVRSLIEAGRPDQAERLLIPESAVTSSRHRYSVLTAMAVVAEARGRLEEAARRYRDVAGRWAEYGFPLEEGLTLLGEGRCRLALAEPDVAEELLSRARGILDRLGATGPVDEIDRLLGGAEALSS